MAKESADSKRIHTLSFAIYACGRKVEVRGRLVRTCPPIESFTKGIIISMG